MLYKLIALILISVPMFAEQAAAQGDTSCKQVIEACEKAGFTQINTKNGKGLYANCVNLIMQGEQQPEKAALSLPILNESVVKDCKAKHPKFGLNFKK